MEGCLQNWVLRGVNRLLRCVAKEKVGTSDLLASRAGLEPCSLKQVACLVTWRFVVAHAALFVSAIVLFQTWLPQPITHPRPSLPSSPSQGVISTSFPGPRQVLDEFPRIVTWRRCFPWAPDPRPRGLHGPSVVWPVLCQELQELFFGLNQLFMTKERCTALMFGLKVA